MCVKGFLGELLRLRIEGFNFLTQIDKDSGIGEIHVLDGVAIGSANPDV
jgi:hypothetical protein